MDVLAREHVLIHAKKRILSKKRFHQSLDNLEKLHMMIFPQDYFEQQYPKILKSCNVFCANKLAKNDYFIKLILQMDIYKKRKEFLKVQKRIPFLDAVTKFGSIILSHQQDNALNYLYLEALYLNLPILHNSSFIKEYGYYYPENDIDFAKLQMQKILKEHKIRIAEYSYNSRKIIQKYSFKNPNNISIYKKIIISLFT